MSTTPCVGNYGKCMYPAKYKVTSNDDQGEPIRHVCKTHVSWALSHTAYQVGMTATIERIKGGEW